VAVDHEKELRSGVGLLDMFKKLVDRRQTLLSGGTVTLQVVTRGT
jgi:hypothetical protein